MYVYRWKHHAMFLNDRMDEYLTLMVAGHELGHDVYHRELAKGEGMREFEPVSYTHLLVPIHSTNGQSSQPVISYSLRTPIPEYAAASSIVRFSLCHKGMLYFCLLYTSEARTSCCRTGP